MIIPVHVTPKSAKNQIIGWVTQPDGKKELKVKITTAPEDGKANKALIKFLAKEWKISPSRLTLVFGETSRHKRLKIEGDNDFIVIPSDK